MKRDFQNISLLPLPTKNHLMNVNLDALIPREDFDIKDTSKSDSPLTMNTIQIRDLEKSSFFYNTLRKPDFQRETSEWKPERICDLVQSFVDGDLIPSIILWNSGSNNFVIDGAHRLSALIAWVFDDYGDSAVSKSFFDFNISLEQNDIADKTRKLINKRIGSYKDYQFAINNQDKVEPKILERAKRLGRVAIQLQWVIGDSHTAEISFFKINDQPAPINDTERKLLKSRNKPNAISARAIIHSGTGHKYWSKFSQEHQNQIEYLSKNINEILFTPKIKTPIKTLDVPLAGKGYSAQTLSLIFDLGNLANSVSNETELHDDLIGDETIKFISKTKKVLNRISGTDPSSLGLHPVIYFYSSGGRYQITAFLAIIELMKDYEGQKDAFLNFTTIRKDFEMFLIKYKNFVNQIVTKYGSGLKSYLRMKMFFSFVINSFLDNKTESEIVALLKVNEFNFLKSEELEITFDGNKNFTPAVKSATYINEALSSAVKCKICNGYIHTNSITFDHKDRKSEGGLGNIENAQLAHPYCNTTFKR